MNNQNEEKETELRGTSAVNALVTPQGIYKIIEDGCVYYYLAAVNEEDALEKIKKHFLDVAYNERDLEHVDVEAKRLDDDHMLTMNYDNRKIELSAKDWYAIASVANFEWDILGCSEWC